MWKQLWSSVIRSEETSSKTLVKKDTPVEMRPKPDPVDGFPFWWRETYEKIITKGKK